MATPVSIARVWRSAGRGMLSAVAFLITLISSYSCGSRKEKVQNVDQVLLKAEGAGEGMTLSSWEALKRLPGINADRVAEATLQRSENGWQLMNLTLRPYGWGKYFPEQSSRCSQGKEGIFYVAMEKSLLPAIEKLMAAELDSRNIADSLAVEEVKSSGLLVGLTGGLVAGLTGVRAVERVESVQELTAVLHSIPPEVKQVHVMMGGICK